MSKEINIPLKIFPFHKADTFINGDPRTGVCFSVSLCVCTLYLLIWKYVEYTNCLEVQSTRRENMSRFIRRNKLTDKPREKCIVPESLWRNWWQGEGFCWSCVSCCHKSEVRKNATVAWPDRRNTCLIAQVPPRLPWLQAADNTCKWNKRLMSSGPTGDSEQYLGGRPCGRQRQDEARIQGTHCE